MTPYKSAIFSFTFLTLAACGGGSTGISATALAEDTLALAERAGPLAITDLSTLPASGTATYEGSLGFRLNDDTPYGGRLNLNVNFGADTVDGQADSFFTTGGTPVGGTLTIDDGDIDRGANTATEYSIVAGLTGALTDQSSTIDVDGYIAAEFLGSDREVIAGEVRGVVSVNGTPNAFTESYVLAD